MVTVLAAAVVMLSLAAAPRQGTVARFAPLDNPSGTQPGLAPTTSAGDRAEAVRLIRRLPVDGRGAKTGYERTRYGGAWIDTARDVPMSRNGCSTRDDLLARDGQKVTYQKGSDCLVTSLRLRDPYTGKTIEWRRDRDVVQVDHVVPLAYGWRMGASRWTESKRLRFANDPLNLLPVLGTVNEAKGGSGPASWLPPSRRARCSYSVRFAQVALKYHLPVTRRDKAAMLAQCR
ncbi:HNH endonuclease family protein [Streptosporangium sp. KLBMP 9127]|nr:HNH endonuclease family protein [Streptosporangium sp. KLBMP 9127]